MCACVCVCVCVGTVYVYIIHFYIPGDKEPTMCLDFNNKRDPFKNSKGFYVSWSRYNTATVLDTGIEGLALRFTGDRLEIPAYNNKVNNLFIHIYDDPEDTSLEWVWGRACPATLVCSAACFSDSRDPVYNRFHI